MNFSPILEPRFIYLLFKNIADLCIDSTYVYTHMPKLANMRTCQHTHATPVHTVRTVIRVHKQNICQDIRAHAHAHTQPAHIYVYTQATRHLLHLTEEVDRSPATPDGAKSPIGACSLMARGCEHMHSCAESLVIFCAG